jgi:crotonobetainyl-CoA:carnitine CoA-transferase CaiB-like acyl-CoA transferase
MLADLGASVVKIDPPGPSAVDGKPRRSAGPLAQNLGKRSIVLDLKHPDGLAVARRLASQADVLVQNYRPGGLAELGLGYAALRLQNPGLIYTTIAGFGQDTSFADRGAYGATAHAEAGLLWVQQQAQGGDRPFPPGVTVADIVTGMNACTAIVAALYDRMHTGHGQEIDISLMDSQLAFLGEAAADGPITAGAPWTPRRHGLQRTLDGYLTINLGPPKNWPRLAAAIGQPGLQMPTEPGKADQLVADWAATVTTEHAATALRAAGAAYGVMKSMPDAFDHPYFAERGMVVEVPDPLLETVRTSSSPLFFSDAVSAPAGPAPLAGEHTRAVLSELGYEDSAIEQVLQAGAAQSVSPQFDSAAQETAPA